MDKSTRKDNRRREYRRQSKGANKARMAALVMRVQQTMGIPNVIAVPWSADPVYIPRHCDVVKRKRREAHRERCAPRK